MIRAASALRRGLPSAAAGVAAPADRRFRRPDVRPGRPRRFRQAVGRAARWMVPAAIVCGLGAWGAKQILDSSWMKVTAIDVRGNSRLSIGEIDALVAGLRDERIFDVDLDAYRKRLMDSPWVAAVSLARVLPSTIEVRITERAPLAVARLGQQLYLVDDSGVIIDEFGPQYRDFDLPIIDGLVTPPSTGTPLVDVARVHLVVSFLSSLDARPDLRRRLSQVDVVSAHDVVVMLDDDTAWLHIGETRFAERLTGYLELAPTLRARFTEIDYVDLRFDDRVFVRSKGQAADVTKAGQEN
jgi:cell division protein FtsQ